MSEELEKWAWDEACRIFHDTANNHHVWGSIATAPEDWQYNLKLEYANAIVAAHKSSQARLSEAVKVLEELGTAVSIYRLGVKDTVPKIAAGERGDMATINALVANNGILDESLSKARQFLASLGVET